MSPETIPEVDRRRLRHRKSSRRTEAIFRCGDVRFMRAGMAAVAIVALLGAIYLLGVTDRFNDAPKTPTVVSLGLSAPLAPVYAGAIVAWHDGLFAKNNVQAELRPGRAGADPIVAVVKGADTFGLTDSISFLVARSNGQPIVAFAADFLEQPVVFYALDRLQIHAPQDFIGKRIGRQANTNKAIMYDALLKATGLSRSQISESAADTSLGALLAGKVDVIPGDVGEEGYTLREKDIPYTVIRTSDYGVHVPGNVYFTTEKMIRDHPDVVERVLEAIIAGWRIVYDDPTKAASIIAAAIGKSMSPQQLRFALVAQRDFVVPLGRRVAEFDDQQWKQLVAILTSARLIDGPSFDLSRAINYSFLKEAYRKRISFGN